MQSVQTVQMPGDCNAVCGTVHYEKPLKSFDKIRTFRASFEVHDCAESDVMQYSLTPHAHISIYYQVFTFNSIKY